MTTTSTSSDDDDNESQLNNIVGYLKLKTRPKQKFISYLNSINTSRYISIIINTHISNKYLLEKTLSKV